MEGGVGGWPSAAVLVVAPPWWAGCGGAGGAGGDGCDPPRSCRQSASSGSESASRWQGAGLIKAFCSIPYAYKYNLVMRWQLDIQRVCYHIQSFGRPTQGLNLKLLGFD